MSGDTVFVIVVGTLANELGTVAIVLLVAAATELTGATLLTVAVPVTVSDVAEDDRTSGLVRFKPTVGVVAAEATLPMSIDAVAVAPCTAEISFVTDDVSVARILLPINTSRLWLELMKLELMALFSRSDAV